MSASAVTSDREPSSAVAVSSSDDSVAAATPHDDEDRRYCWVCFATDEDDVDATWVKPCRCSGTTKWVHQMCIQRWVDEKQKGNSGVKVSCPQCNTEYVIVYPRMGALVQVLDALDSMVYKACPFIVAGVVVGSVYWTAVTYGAVTIMQVVGHKEGLLVMEQADPLLLLVGLPTIPIALVLAKMVRWEDCLLRFLRKHSCHLPLLCHLMPSPVLARDPAPGLQNNGSQQHPPPLPPPPELPPLSDPMSATRVLCGALLLPTLATFFGRVLFDSVPSNLQRAILGGVAFISIKGVLKIYHKQQQYVRQCQRRILDYKASGPAPVESPTPAIASPERSNQ